MISNRFQYVPRETISGHVGGIDWGYNLSCIMRSPTRALFWSGGSSYWSGMLGNAYGSSGLACYWRLSAATIKRYGPGYRTGTGEGSYIDIGARGRRLDRVPLYERISEADWQKLASFIGEDLEEEIGTAIHFGTTLLIEGGGYRFTPRIPHRAFKV